MANIGFIERLIFRLLVLAFAVSGSIAHSAALRPNALAPRPNILVIVADDMGFADLNINNPRAGSPTPNLNELARSGTRFTRFYTESSCSPSRAALLTGRYPARLNFLPNGLGIPGELTTLPETFKAAGYRTHMIGKWHLGHLVREAWPDAQGFDTWLGFLSPSQMNSDDRRSGFEYSGASHLDVYLQDEKGTVKQFPGHLTDVVTDEAVQFLRNKDVKNPAVGSGKRGQPWFMYLAYFAPHDPLQPRADYAAQFPDTDAGRYAAVIAHLDARIGDVLKTLDATGQRENTIVVFASDNGGTNRYLDSNTPFKGNKVQYLEGGIRTPLLVSWPAKVPAGFVTDQVISIMDIYPTLARLTHLPSPSDLDGRAFFNDDGSPVATPDPRALFWEIRSNLARSYSVLSSDGRWRLHELWFGKMALFDLQADPISAVDVAASHPEIVRQLQSGYDTWRTETARIDLAIEQRDAQGHGILVGDDLQRAATFGGFTVALGITPAHGMETGTQVILEQKPTFRIDRDSSGLHVQLHGLSATLPALPPARCSSLVITGTFNRRIDGGETQASSLNIYLDGNKTIAIEQKAPLLNSTNLHAPTYIGYAEGGSQRFDGSLATPVYLNTRADSPVPPALTVAALARQVCGQATDSGNR